MWTRSVIYIFFLLGTAEIVDDRNKAGGFFFAPFLSRNTALTSATPLEFSLLYKRGLNHFFKKEKLKHVRARQTEKLGGPDQRGPGDGPEEER